MAQTDLFTFPQKPWNAGRLVGAKTPLKPKHIWGIRQQLKSTGRVRDLAMFNCALDAKLRGCDLVALRLGDVVQGGSLRARSVVVQQKTGRPVPFEITPPARDALARWLEIRGDHACDWLFPSRMREGEHISTRQYARLVDSWVRTIDLDVGEYGTHSLRRTKVALIYKQTGNLRACQLLLGHGKLESTVAIWVSKLTTPSPFRSRLSSRHSSRKRTLSGSATGGERNLNSWWKAALDCLSVRYASRPFIAYASGLGLL